MTRVLALRGKTRRSYAEVARSGWGIKFVKQIERVQLQQPLKVHSVRHADRKGLCRQTTQ